jgi:hypothetical protein
LTRKKLELTRLPHELLLPPEREWENGTPKSEIEPLIDYWYVPFLLPFRSFVFWGCVLLRSFLGIIRRGNLEDIQADLRRLEQYSWRSREDHFNALPQYRTLIQIPGSNSLRIHFLHIRSPHASAIPLLLIPSFPLTNLALPPSLYTPLLNPSNTSEQAFHIIIPSLPGLGFSDSFTSHSPTPLADTADVLNALMCRLGYETYLVSGTGSGKESPAGVDYYLPLLLSERWENCRGVHLISPDLQRPRWGSWAWWRFVVARFFHAGIFGYEISDFKALQADSRRREVLGEGERMNLLRRKTGGGYGAVGMIGLREPNTLAYALCDSPVGLLSLVASALSKRSPKHMLEMESVVDVCQLAWLPGPEAGMRLWSRAVGEVESLKVRGRKRTERARVAVSVFEDEEEGYVCPAWAEIDHDLIWSQRVGGRAGLVPWEQQGVVVEGVRGLAEALKKVDARLRITELESVVVESEETIVEEDEEGDGLQLDVESPDTVVAVSLA